MSDFDKLLEELNALGEETETMSKAMSDADGADDSDEKIQGAAADGGDGDDEGADAGAADGGEGGDGDGDGDDDDGDEQMGKSFMLQLEDGSEVEAFDGTEMLKSLQAQLKANDERSSQALEQAVGLVRKQGDMLKSLQEKVASLQNAGRGRKAVVSVADAGKEPLKKSEDMPANEFMAKALTAQKEGRITGLDVSRMESYLNKGLALPQDLVDKVFQ